MDLCQVDEFSSKSHTQKSTQRYQDSTDIQHQIQSASPKHISHEMTGKFVNPNYAAEIINAVKQFDRNDTENSGENIEQVHRRH